MNCAVALDIGGSHITAAVVDLTTRIVIPESMIRRGLDHTAPADTLLELWGKTALEAVSRVPTASISGVGIAMPGPFDYQHGISYLEHKFASLYGQHLNTDLMQLWKNTRLHQLKPRFANDAALFALGEAWAGAAIGKARVIGITLGTGLGSGFIEHGKIITQGYGISNQGELWNVPYADGIAEDYASGRALGNANQLAAQARDGNIEAQKAFLDMGHHLRAILEPWVESFQPDAIVIGGNVAKAWDLFSAPLTQHFGLSCYQTQHFEQATLLGAAIISE
jgi:glucokinase